MPLTSGSACRCASCHSASFAAIDQGDAQRPILGRQAADLDMGAFDDRKHHHVGRAVGLDHLQLSVPFLKNRPIASQRSLVMSAPRVGLPPNGDISVKSCVSVISAQVVVDVPAHQRRIRFLGSPDEFGDLLIVGSTRTSAA